MRLALLTDTHWGVRNDNIFFLEQNKKFLDNVFFPTLEKENINTVIHLGDLVDRRKYVNILTANRVREDFLNPLKQKNINFYIIAGNHDTYHKNTNAINALQELIVDKYPFHVIDNNPLEITFDGLDILFVPWICDQNKNNIISCIQATNAQICMGHLEIEKFPMYKGMPSEHGYPASMFEKFDMVMSGHYHTRSHAKNIWYLGAHAEFIWSDYNDPRGFHIFDTNTRELTFIENPYRVFYKIFYDDTKELPVLTNDISSSIIKVVIQSKEDPYKFDAFISSIEKMNPIEMQIVEDHLNLHLEDETNIIDEAESTLDIFKKYVSKLEISPTMKEPLEQLIIELYTEALSIEETWQ
jgi:DNA repair exonuclease SbcCD nuclease subunit